MNAQRSWANRAMRVNDTTIASSVPNMRKAALFSRLPDRCQADEGHREPRPVGPVPVHGQGDAVGDGHRQGDLDGLSRFSGQGHCYTLPLLTLLICPGFPCGSFYPRRQRSDQGIRAEAVCDNTQHDGADRGHR